MKKRKAVAVCVTKYDWEYESKIIEGIRRQCAADDIDLLVFSNLMEKVELGTDRVIPENIVRGEVEIYNLINYEMLDGIIILGDNMLQNDIIEKVSKKAAEYGVPTLNIHNPENVLDYNIELSDSTAMERIVDHIIEEHGMRKINFIGGFPGNFQTEERLSAYKRSLEKHGIPFEEKRVAYGRFWKWAQDCTKEFLDSGDIPEAIVCASDTMALFCMDEIKSRGMKIPGDIVVTGFDGTPDCEKYTPSVTSVRHAYLKAGIKAIEVLESVWSGKETPKFTIIEAELLINESCGCKSQKRDYESFYDQFYKERDHRGEFDYYCVDMNTKSSEAKTPEELFGCTANFAKFFGFSEFYICVSEGINSGKVKFQNGSGYIGMGGRAVSMLKSGHDIPEGTVFPTKDLIPTKLLGRDEPVFMAFVPFYFRNCFLGYFAFCPTRIEGDGKMFLTLSMNISNNAGTFYMNKELKDVADELRNINMTDPLTGICNRRGLYALAPEIMRHKSGFINIVCADVDGLKPINDTYGHEGGDNAIIVTAKAIKDSMPEDAICARTGGDEFCVVFHSQDEDEAARCVAKVDEFLVKYNEMSALPYKVGCSCGFVTVPCGKVLTMEDMIKSADKNMYSVKLKRKTVRR